MGFKPRPRHGMSWSAMRKILERENICDSLKGRVQYFQTRYTEAHDHRGRIAIRVDGNEIFKACYFEQGDGFKTNGQVWVDSSFYGAFYEYHNSSIENSLESSDPLVRLFAIMDRRIGKRRLDKIQQEVVKQPEWLQIFFKLRLEAEGFLTEKRTEQA